jgi:hypothetical protein
MAADSHARQAPTMRQPWALQRCAVGRPCPHEDDRGIACAERLLKHSMEIVYLETTFISLLVADPSRDSITAANQQATPDWWSKRRHDFQCIVSFEVLRESAKRDVGQARRRQEILRDLPTVEPSAEAEEITLAFLATRALPPRAQTDAAHLGIATAARADYVLTWNCRHLANAEILRRLDMEAARHGWKLPTVCTPPELMGDSAYGTESDSFGNLES